MFAVDNSEGAALLGIGAGAIKASCIPFDDEHNIRARIDKLELRIVEIEDSKDVTAAVQFRLRHSGSHHKKDLIPLP